MCVIASIFHQAFVYLPFSFLTISPDQSNMMVMVVVITKMMILANSWTWKTTVNLRKWR